MNDTIAAVAASGGPIGIIRVSGAQAIGAVSAVFSPKNGSPLAEAASQKLVYGTLSDKNGHLLDACYAVVFRAPHTYTGEDMAEIQCPWLDCGSDRGARCAFRARRAAGRGRRVHAPRVSER